MKHPRLIFLKIKLKSLAAEAAIIRHEEEKQADCARKGYVDHEFLRESMALHRRYDIRREARATHLAYGFLRGKRYRQMEPYETKSNASEVTWLMNRTKAMIGKYCGISPISGPTGAEASEAMAEFQKWCEEPPVAKPSFASEVAAVV